MTKKGVIRNMGTITKSSTEAFMETMAARDDMSTIEQSGVDLYSACLISNKVRVASNSNENDEQQIKELVNNELADEELAGMSRARKYRHSMAGCLELQLAVLASAGEVCRASCGRRVRPAADR